MNNRKSKIIELITNNSIETQDELLNLLTEHNYKVTQSTISRDIKELDLVKIQDGEKYRYALRGDNSFLRLQNMYRESVISIVSSKNIIVVKTLAGTANAAANAIDKLAMKEIIGSVAGDDTVILVIEETADAEKVKDYLMKMKN